MITPSQIEAEERQRELDREFERLQAQQAQADALQAEVKKRGVEIVQATSTAAPLITHATSLLDMYEAKIDRNELPQLLRQHDALHGLEVGPELLSIIGAPPGAGKTALASQIAFDATDLDPELRVYVANAEMGFGALIRRQLTKLTRINSDRIRFGDLDAGQREQVRDAFAELRAKMDRFFVLENPTLVSLTELVDQPPGLIIVDYLQKFAPADKEPRVGVNLVVTWLRKLASQGHAILALSSTKRDAGGKHDSKNLTMASFKESGEVEFQADSAYVLQDTGPIDEGCKYIRKVKLAHLKNRHGAKVDRELEFHMPRMEFTAQDPAPFAEFADYAELEGAF